MDRRDLRRRIGELTRMVNKRNGVSRKEKTKMRREIRRLRKKLKNFDRD